MLLFRDIPLGGGDEAVCRRCAAAGSPVPGAQTADPTARIDAALSATPGAGVFFTQVGAADHPGLPGLVEHAARAGAPRVAVSASGRSLSDPAVAARLVDSGVRIVEVTFLGSCAQVHDALTGVPGDFDAATAAVANVRSTADARGLEVAVRGRVRVCHHNLQDMPATVMRLAEMEVANIILACDPTMDTRRSADWIAAACDTGTVNRVWVAVSGMDEAALGDKELHAVDPVTLLEESA